MADPYSLQRFVDAQQPVFEHVLEELRAGSKQRHWIWFVFPQIHGLGSSSMAQMYAISSRAEAHAYLEHAVLGPRLLQCVRLVNGLENRTAEQIFGPLDAMKFRSSMTLFAAVAGEASVFVEALRKYFAGAADERTLEKLR